MKKAPRESGPWRDGASVRMLLDADLLDPDLRLRRGGRSREDGERYGGDDDAHEGDAETLIHD